MIIDVRLSDAHRRIAFLKEMLPGDAANDLVLIASQDPGIFKPLVFRIVEVLYVVERRDGQDVQLVFRSKADTRLAQKIPILRHETKTGSLEDEIEIASSGRKECIDIASRRAFEVEAELAGGDRRFSTDAVLPPFAKRDIQHRGELVAISGAKSSRRKGSVVNKVEIDEAERTAAGTLRAKVVDIRHLDVVNDEEVFRRSSAPDNEVVASAIDLGNARENGDCAGNVFQSAGEPADFLVCLNECTERRVRDFGEVPGGHFHSLNLDLILHEADQELRRLCGAHNHVRDRRCKVSDRRDANGIGTKRYTANVEAPLNIGGGAKARSGDDDICADDGLLGHSVGDLADDPAQW